MSNIYLGTIDGGGDGKVLLLAAINRALNKNWTLNDFDFGEPEAVSVSSPTHNTVIPFGPKLTSGGVGVRKVYYNRIHAAELGNIIVPWNNEMFIKDLLPKINAKYGVLIQESDIIDDVVPSPPSGQSNVQVNLTFSATSIIFYSSTQIQVGLNDPTGDTVVVDPFNASIAVAFNQTQEFELEGEQRVILEPFVFAMDRDNTRVEMSVVARTLFQDNTSARSRITMSKQTFDNLEDRLPFVGMWKNPQDNTTFAITVLGDIYSMPQESKQWTFVANGLGYNTQSSSVVLAGYNDPYVKGVAQGSDGSVYFLAKAQNQDPKVWKSTAAGTGWVALGISATRMKTLTASAWPTLKVLDILHSGDRLWVLLQSTETYDTHPQKSRVTPSVEVLNTVTNTSDYYPLADTTASYTGIAFDKTSPSNRWKLVTPPVGATAVDVVALLSTVNNNNTVAVYYRYQTVGEYTATILPHGVLAKDASARKEMDIVAYQLPLLAVQATAAGVSVVGHYLDVVEIHTVVEVSNFNRNFLLTQNKTEQGYFSFGIKALTSVASRAGRTPWVETNIPLTSSQKPIPVILQGLGIRQHVSLQNATAIHSLRFRQTPTTTNFVAEVDSSRVLEAHTGFDRVSTRGAGVWAKPVVVEDGTVTAALVSNQNYEATMAPIVYSFIGQTSGGEKKWLTAQTPGTILVERTPSFNYAFMGKVPALIAAEGSNLLFWSNQGNGAFISSNQGASWTEFNNAPVFYKQERPASPALNVLGYSNVSLNQDNFKEGTFVNGVFTVEVKLDNQVKTFNFNTGTTAANYQLTDNILYTLKPSTQGNAYVSSGEQAGYGLNSLSLHSPRQILAWDIDSENRFETIGRYTTAIATPLDTKYNFDNYLFNVSGNLIDFSRDVRYLGYRHWVLVDDAGVYKLHFTNGVMPEKTIEMFGSTTNIALAAFKPEVSFHLWDYLDAAIGYIPYAFYHNGKVVILSRLDVANEFTADLFVLSIPNDNGNPLKPVKMYTANRRDYLFFQKGNGIFKLTYAYNGVDGVTTVGLEEVFDLTAGAQAQLEIFSGAIHGIAAQDAPQETDVPDNLPLGYYIGKECGANYTMLHRYADGNGGYTITEEINSEECGFIPESDVAGGTAFFEGDA